MVHPPRSGVFTPKIKMTYSTIYSIYPQKTASTCVNFYQSQKFSEHRVFITNLPWRNHQKTSGIPPAILRSSSPHLCGPEARGNWEMFDLSFPIVFARSMSLEVGKFPRIWQVSRILLLVWKVVYLLGHPESNPRTFEHLHSQTWVGLTLMFFLLFFSLAKIAAWPNTPTFNIVFSLAYVFLLFSPWCCWWCPGFWCLHHFTSHWSIYIAIIYKPSPILPEMWGPQDS